jgi:hypothetical protein
MEHNFQLVISRAFEEEDEEIIDEEEDSTKLRSSLAVPNADTPIQGEAERSFLVSEELHFHVSQRDGEPTLLWRDVEGDIDEFYEFVAAGTNAPTCAFFETCMYRAMYERKYKRSADNIKDSALAEFTWQCVKVLCCQW